MKKSFRKYVSCITPMCEIIYLFSYPLNCTSGSWNSIFWSGLPQFTHRWNIFQRCGRQHNTTIVITIIICITLFTTKEFFIMIFHQFALQNFLMVSLLFKLLCTCIIIATWNFNNMKVCVCKNLLWLHFFWYN